MRAPTKPTHPGSRKGCTHRCLLAFRHPSMWAAGVYNLKANMMLEDLYLTGNPCDKLSGWLPNRQRKT